MSAVISFAKAKAEREPHWEGEVRCVGCQHEWQGSGPIGELWIDCPECKMPKGLLRYPFGARPEDLSFQCMCGCDALHAYKREGRFFIRCMRCGTDQTAAIYGDAP